MIKYYLEYLFEILWREFVVTRVWMFFLNFLFSNM